MVKESSGRKLWHYNSNKIERRRYFEPITASMALGGLTALAGTAGVGAGIAGAFGAFGGKKQKEDPLAAIREQLMGLASQVPGLVEKQKTQTAENIGKLKEEGKKSIGEGVYAERGLGRTSIYDRLQGELFDKLARAQAEADLKAEMWGVEQQGRLLTGAGSMGGQEEAEPDIWGQLAGMGGQVLGQQLGMGQLEKLLGTKTPISPISTDVTTPQGKFFESYAETPAAKTFGANAFANLLPEQRDTLYT